MYKRQVPEGSSVAAALDGGVLLAAAEPDAGDAVDWAADYDWYTLDEAGEKVPYDISAAVTAELELYVQDAARAADATTVLFYAAIDGTWTVVAQKKMCIRDRSGHFLRPQRCNDHPHHRLCHAVLRQRAAGNGSGGGGPPERHQGPRAVPALL